MGLPTGTVQVQQYWSALYPNKSVKKALSSESDKDRVNKLNMFSNLKEFTKTDLTEDGDNAPCLILNSIHLPVLWDQASAYRPNTIANWL